MANILAAEKRKLTSVYNIGCGELITINYLAEMMKSIVDKNAEIFYASPRKGEILHCVADVLLAKNFFGFKASTEMYENLEEYIEWMRSEIEG